jgi:RND family efflux transporter MFP subunit
LEAEIAATDTSAKVVKIKDVKVTAVQPTGFRHYIDIQGAVDAEDNVAVQPLQPGKVMRILVNEGDQVKAGQLLAELEHDIQTKQLNSLQPQLDLAKDMFARQQRLWDQKIGSEMQYLQAKTQKESIEKQMETLQEQIDMSLIKAPIAGTVDHVGLKIGQIAMSMTVEPAFRIVNLSNLKVKGEIAEAYASKVKKGNPVLLHFPDLNKDVTANISFVERVIDPLTRTFTTEANLSGDNSEYHPNQVVILKVVDYENTAAFVIPINSVQNSSTEQFVYIAEQEGDHFIARKRLVQVGNTYDGNAEILAGLNANDQLITSGQFDLADGVQIKF